MTRGWLILLLVACKSSEKKGAAPPPVVADAAIAPAVDAPPELPTAGVANTAVASVPRKDWPCRLFNTSPDIAIETRFTYGTRTECMLPVDVQAMGVVGCPDRVEQENLDNHAKMADEYRYDNAGRLVERKTIATSFIYDWDEQLLRSYRVRDEHRGYATDGGTAVIDGERITVEGGHVTASTSALGGDLEMKKTFEWKGGRLAKIVNGDHYERADYNCKKPAR